MKPKRPREPAYVKHRREMLESPAWQSLTLPARRVLDRFEIELMRHAGKNNGTLIVTYQQLIKFGVRRMSISPAIQLLVDVGLLKITQHGWRAAGHHRPAHYRLTYLDANGSPATDEWKAYAQSCGRTKTRVRPSIENATRAGIENDTGNGIPQPKNRYRKRYSYLNAIHDSPPVKDSGGDGKAPPRDAGTAEVIDIPDFLSRRGRNPG